MFEISLFPGRFINATAKIKSCIWLCYPCEINIIVIIIIIIIIFLFFFKFIIIIIIIIKIIIIIVINIMRQSKFRIGEISGMSVKKN